MLKQYEACVDRDSPSLHRQTDNPPNSIRDTHGTFRPEDKDFKVSKQAPLASTVAVPPSIPEEQAPIQPHLVTKTDGDRPKQV